MKGFVTFKRAIINHTGIRRAVGGWKIIESLPPPNDLSAHNTRTIKDYPIKKMEFAPLLNTIVYA